MFSAKESAFAGCLFGAVFTLLLWMYTNVLLAWAPAFSKKKVRQWGLLKVLLLSLFALYFMMVGKAFQITFAFATSSFIAFSIGTFLLRLMAYALECFLRGMLERHRVHSQGHFGAHTN